MTARIIFAEAARMTGMTPQAIRIQMQRGLLDFGIWYAYCIMRERVEKYVRGDEK